MPGEDCTGCPERGSGVRERETRRSGEVARGWDSMRNVRARIRSLRVNRFASVPRGAAAYRLSATLKCFGRARLPGVNSPSRPFS